MFSETRLEEFSRRAKALHQELRGNMVLGLYEAEIASLASEIRRSAEDERKLWDTKVREMADSLWEEAGSCEHAHPERSKDLRVIATNLHRLRREITG